MPKSRPVSKHSLSVAFAMALVEVRQDADNYLVLIRAESGKPFVYYTGAAWDKGRDFHDRAGWEVYVREQKPDFGVLATADH